LIFDAKLRFALFASLRSAIFSETKYTTNWSLSPQGLIVDFSACYGRMGIFAAFGALYFGEFYMIFGRFCRIFTKKHVLT